MFRAMTERELAAPETVDETAAPSGLSRPKPEDSSRRRAPLASRYRSLFVIGRGGMGTVEAALAVHAEDDGAAYERIVALKRLLPDGARDKRRVDMFLREARLAAMLDHPNVVRAYDYGEIDGELFLAMEYVEGQPLSRVLRALDEAGERMPIGVAAYVLSEVCRGLHAAHELADPTTGLPLQLVHRDVSPQNVMLGYDGRVHLLDFGVAKIETENVTKTGEVKGKTAYMSPEQAMGESLDRRSDLFGVGAILYECLALRRMWGDGTDMEVIRRLALESPPALESCGVDLPKGLSELHARLVAREAKHRPATAIEATGDLLAFIDDKDKAAAALCAMLEKHFADQARERRAKLTASLLEVAPGQAEELRESVLPVSNATPVRPRIPAAEPEPEARPASATEARATSPARARLAGIAALVVAGSALVWWRSNGSNDHPVPSPTSTTVPAVTAPAVTGPVVTAPLTPSAEPARGDGAPSATASAHAVTTATASTRPPHPLGRPHPTASPNEHSQTSAPPTATATNAPPTATATATSTKPKPPDIDDHPF
jgi:serine/threonine-protein kinase